jgi:hypothetical protein
VPDGRALGRGIHDEAVQGVVAGREEDVARPHEDGSGRGRPLHRTVEGQAILDGPVRALDPRQDLDPRQGGGGRSPRLDERDLDHHRVVDASLRHLEPAHGDVVDELVGVGSGLEEALEPRLERRTGRDDARLETGSFRPPDAGALPQDPKPDPAGLPRAGYVGQPVRARLPQRLEGGDRLLRRVLDDVDLLFLQVGDGTAGSVLHHEVDRDRHHRCRLRDRGLRPARRGEGHEGEEEDGAHGVTASGRRLYRHRMVSERRAAGAGPRSVSG